MADTKIEWTDKVWTPIVGCDAVSSACAFCYAALMAARLEAMGMEKYAGLATRHGSQGKWTGKVTLWEPEVLKPLTVKKPARWFLTSMGDVFHEKVPFDFIDRLFAVMALTPQHTYYVLTKRPETAAKYLADQRQGLIARAVLDMTISGELPKSAVTDETWPVVSIGDDIDFPDDVTLKAFPLPNVLIGCTAEDQQRADERRPHMDEIAGNGWRTFVSYEPALGPVDWSGWEFLSWLISGGESGHNARPSHPDWHRSARDFCATAGIPYHFKQWGEWAPAELLHHDNGRASVVYLDHDPTFEEPTHPRYVEWTEMDPIAPATMKEVVARVGKKTAGHLLDGVEHLAVPEVGNA